MTRPASGTRSFSSSSIGPISGISLVLAAISRSASTIPSDAADSRNRLVPSARTAPRASLPSQASDGCRTGPLTGKAAGSAGSAAER